MHSFPSTRVTDAFERRVTRAIDTHVAPHQGVVVACSGGPDSTATLIAVARTRVAGALVVAAHFDHRLRTEGESRADWSAVQAVAERLGVRAVSGTAPAALGRSEVAARTARYGWLASACAETGARWCATGHTLDDQAETVLLRLARGSGLTGAAGMAASVPWPVECGADGLRLVRPLLRVRRADVIAYLAALGVEPRSDPSNDLDTFDRNRVRHHVLPRLRDITPQADVAIARFADLARQDDEALDVWAHREAQAIVHREDGGVEVDRRALRALPPAVGGRLLRSVAVELGVSLDAGQVATLLRLAGRQGAWLDLGDGLAAAVGAVTVRLARGHRRLTDGRTAGDVESS